jgi:hypothetical protein
MHRDDSENLVYAEELEFAIQDTLAKLAALDVEHDARRATLHRRSLSQGQRHRLATQLEKHHRDHREPLVLRLADLHYRMMRSAIFGSLAYPVPSISAMRGMRK